MSKISTLAIIGRLTQACENAFWRFWWVCLVVLIGLIMLEQRLKILHNEREQLFQQYLFLIEEKEKALTLKENLKLQINSQSDPAWVELTLKKGLGLVPEGQTKVLFID